MFSEDITAAGLAAKKKSDFLKKNPLGYFLFAMLAGAYIGFGVILTNVIGFQLDGAPATKLLQGLTFGVGLSLVVIAGAELFTGNNFVMMVGVLKKTVSVRGALLLWLISWIGNLAGSAVLSLLYVGTGLPQGGVAAYMQTAALAKISAGPLPLLTRGILCNVLVCLAVWCGFRAKTEAGKLVMVVWCLLAFITTGFEHCVANMTLFTTVLFCDPAAIPVTGVLYNLLLVTLGNMIGGICFVALPYFIGGKEK